MFFLTELEIVLRLLAATACGVVLGWEREAQRKAAGLRTHMLVCLGAATFTALGAAMTRDGGSEADPVRVIQGVATGIGFLGAGQIFRAHDTVHGLTTAAGIWLVGAVGVACGVGQYLIAVFAVLLGFVTLAVVARVETVISGPHKPAKVPRGASKRQPATAPDG
jgi:putative Mg2+ transporter-C (MgtC) family protein